jgi:hypothetical protein
MAHAAASGDLLPLETFQMPDKRVPLPLSELLAKFRTSMDHGAFGRGVLALATRSTAAALLDSLPEPERTQFEWWFVATHWDRIPSREHPLFNFGGSLIDDADPDEHPERIVEAMHRAILARRET